MKTINGILLDTEDNPQHAIVSFVSKSTPLVAGQTITANTTISIKTDKLTGAFSVTLEPGNYDVIYYTTPRLTQFSIQIPPDIASPASIGDVTSTPLTFVSVPPNAFGLVNLNQDPVQNGQLTIKQISSVPTLEFMYSGTVYTIPGPFSGTANRAVVTGGGGALAVSSVTSTELGYVSGVTSAIQTQLDKRFKEQVVSFVRNDTVMIGEYVGGVVEFTIPVYLKSAIITVRNRPLTGSVRIQLEINGVPFPSQRFDVTPGAGEFSALIDLSAVAVVNPSLAIRWSVVTSGSDPAIDGMPSGLDINTTVSTV